MPRYRSVVMSPEQLNQIACVVSPRELNGLLVNGQPRQRGRSRESTVSRARCRCASEGYSEPGLSDRPKPTKDQCTFDCDLKYSDCIALGGEGCWIVYDMCMMGCQGGGGDPDPLPPEPGDPKPGGDWDPSEWFTDRPPKGEEPP